MDHQSGGEDAAHDADGNGRDVEGHVVLNDLGDGVDLGAAADAEGGDGGQQGKGHPQPFQVQPPLQGVHGAALHFAVPGAHPVLDGDEGLGVLGGDAEHAGDPAPEHRAGAAQEDGGAHPDDVARADGGGQGGGQGLELAHVARGIRVLGDGQADAGEQLALNEAGAGRHEQVGAQQQDDHGNAPDEVVQPVDKCDNRVHSLSPSLKK